MRIGQHARRQMRFASWRSGGRVLPWFGAELDVSGHKCLDRTERYYAQPARLRVPAMKVAFKPPPPPPLPAAPSHQVKEHTTIEDGHNVGEAGVAIGPFDQDLASIGQSLDSKGATSISELYDQYRERGGRMCNYIVPYEERPAQGRRADGAISTVGASGDGIVMVVHAVFNESGDLDKISACSGFVVDARPMVREEQGGEVVVTCAHTLEEMHGKMEQNHSDSKNTSFSYIIPSKGQPRLVTQILSSMPRSDAIAMQIEPSDEDISKLRSLPLSPFPVSSGSTVLTHLFGAVTAPEVLRSQSRLPPSVGQVEDKEKIEMPMKWLDDRAWRRWGAGHMLGYRSYTNIEVEAGIHSSLPHILTSILPSSGSSGGPLVNAETGAVVGMISGRRMDNRVEGERGWGASSESIFEMFSLPGFVPSSAVNG